MKLIRAVTTVGGFTGLSRILGLIREILMSHVLGAGLIADAFIVAFKFPNFFRRFFAEGAFNAAFVPEFAGILSTEGEKSAHHMAEQVFSFLAWFLIAFVLLIEIFTPQLIHIIAPGFNTTPARQELAINFTRITFPYILFISLAALITGVLNSLHRFAVGACAPILLNIFMICALVFFADQAGLSLAYAVLIAGIVQLIWVYLGSMRAGYTLKLLLPHLNPSVRKVLRLMIPGTIGAGVMQINILIDMVLASFLPAGALSYLYYADRLNQLPLSIFGVAIGTVLLPSMSKLLCQNDHIKAMEYQEKAIVLGARLSFPSAVGLMVLAYPIIDLIFGHGKFSPHDVNATSPTLIAFALGLPAYVISKVFTTTFFAVQNTKTPVKVAITAVFCNLLLNIILIPFFQHVGMALATALAAWIQMLCLVFLLKKQSLITLSKHSQKDIFKTILASLAMGFGVFLSKFHIQAWCSPNIWGEITQLILLVFFGIILYISFIFVLNILQKNLEEF